MEKLNLDDTIRKIEDKLVQLSKTSSNEETISICFTHIKESEDIRNLNCSFSTFINTLFSDTVAKNFSENDIVSVENNSIFFTISSGDYLYWVATTKRKNKLQRILDTQNPNGKSDTEQPQSETKQEVKQTLSDKNTEYSIAIADLTEEGLVHIDFYQGKKTDCLSWLNTQIVRHYDIKEQSVMVFNLNYQPSDNYDISKWFTIEELVGQGRVILK